MKKRVTWMLVPALALGLGACKKKETATAPETPTPTEVAEPATPTPTPVPAPPAKTVVLSPEERAAKLGFVKLLPQDTEVVMAFHNGSKSAERVMSSKLWKLVQSEMGMGMGMAPGGLEDMEEMEEDFAPPDAEQDADLDAAAEPEAPEAIGPAALFGTEFTIALGKSTGTQTANLLTLNRRMGYFQMRTMAKALVSAAKSGDFSSLEQEFGNSYGPDLAKGLLTDPESGIALFEKMNMPPLYLAFKTTEAGREAAAQQLASVTESLAMFGDMTEAVEVEKAGGKFAGHKVPGAKVSEMMKEDREGIEEMLDAATVDRLIAAVAKKDLVVVSGTVGEYVVLFVGSSVDDLKFAPDIGQSLVSTDALAFCDAYASKELAAVIYGGKESLNQMMAAAGGLSDMAAGIRDGLSGSDGLGDTRDLETLLRMVGDREAALRKLQSTEATGTVAFFEEGLKIESFGGTDNGMIDWNMPNKLASLGDSEDVVMFANTSTDVMFDMKARAYGEALMETAYAAAMKISQLPIESAEMEQFKQGATIFDTKFRTDLVAIWDAFSGGFSGSIGSERAWVLDLKGTVPAIPGIPQAVVDEGKFPRLSVVVPVEDRTKLASAWGKMNTGLTNILASASEMGGSEIPMQKPMSSEKDGYTTWFFSMPFFNDDFMPSVTVGDKWFAASTSRIQALDLIHKAEAGGATRNGLYFSMNFKALGKFSEETIKMLEKNADSLGMSASDLEQAGKFIAALDDLDSLTAHVRREDGKLRGSVHFKTR